MRRSKYVAALESATNGRNLQGHAVFFIPGLGCSLPGNTGNLAVANMLALFIIAYK
jgi:hypothetical protein